MKMLQLRDFEIELNDIRYNFLIGDHGIFEGRGWDVKTEILPEATHDIETLTIGFFSDNLFQPGNALLERFHKLLVDGRVLRKVAENVEQRCEIGFCNAV